jgi:hypothetical protein
MDPTLWASLLGGGILIALFTSTYQLGRYSQRVDNLEKSVANLTNTISELRGSLGVLERTFAGWTARREQDFRAG